MNRSLTPGEIALARPIFADAIDYSRVRLHRRRWWPFQPRRVAMAPDGDLWFHPRGPLWHDDFAAAAPSLQALLIHELVHVWQAQRGGRWYLPLARHPLCHYRYRLVPGRRFGCYGLEQQATIVEHVWRLRHGLAVAHAPPLAALEALLPFGATASIG